MMIHLKDGCISPVETIKEDIPKYYVEDFDFDYIYFKDDRNLLDKLYTAYGECYIINIGAKAVEGVFLLSDDKVSDIPLESLDKFLENKYSQFINRLNTKRD